MENKRSNVPMRYAHTFSPLEDSTQWSHQSTHGQLDVPMQPVRIDGDYAPLAAQGVSMMAEDWITGQLEPAPVFDRIDWEKKEKLMEEMEPKWAVDAKLSKSAPSCLNKSDQPIR
ncbi:hypothetical protein PSACC_00129 [Paramicrosporidium saccamoebae]|uniref:Uncharacterized protein n=1 Tax=Paramicrosporidium saccamoebae TaxID=1246581 RepID=A0A2H9TQM1_9FUNG|nr:hypothetical protein PSACC_00129 [Paramicrosporidium saccamoebae]